MKIAIRIFFLITVCISCSTFVQGFGILTHEAIIDASWKKSILPLLKQKFPDATEEQLKEAQAYVYGGSIFPDIGYQPFGSILFTNMFHYVRTGDFVENLLDEAKTLDEYAFAIGALCHYSADSYGHPEATNHVVPIVFSRMEKKYGKEVNYNQAPTKHIQVEFGFDVLQTAKGNYVRDTYHNFIGFKVSEEVLKRAFLKTYGLQLKEVFKNFNMAVETFRFSVKSVIPELTKDAWKVRKSAINKLNPLATEENYYYKMKRNDYKHEYNQKFGLKSAFVSLIFGVLPKVGPLAIFKFKEPTDDGEKLYDRTFQTIVQNYGNALQKLSNGKNTFRNVDLDTGQPTARYEYELTDKTYNKVLKRLRKNNFQYVDDSLRKNIVAFYDQKANNAPAKKVSDSKADKALAELKDVR